MLQPKGHYLLVRPDPVEQGLILLPEQTILRERLGTCEGTLVGIGQTAWRDLDPHEPWAQIGDKVIFCQHSGLPIEVDGDMHRIVNDEDILATHNNGEIEPCGKAVIVEIEPEPEKSVGGIYFTEREKDRAELLKIVGHVKKIGPAAWIESGVQWVQEGDRVLISKYGGFLPDLSNMRLRILRDIDILGTVEGETKIFL